MDTVEWDYLYLVACALHKKEPDRQRVALMDLRAIFELSNAHKMKSILSYGLESVSDTLNSDIWDQWKEARDRAIQKAILLREEKKRIVAFLETEGIRYLPLKGILLSELYPKKGMREMSDIDILYDVEKKEQLYQYMISRGYKYYKPKSALGHYVEDVYVKSPFYNFEFHTRLFDKELVDKSVAEYYDRLHDHMIKDEGCEYGYHMTPEDEYLYNVAHGYKHYKLYGIGIRFLVDVYLMLRNHTLDMEYIRHESGLMGIQQFETAIRSLSEKLFSVNEIDKDSLSSEELSMLDYVFKSGVYGNQNNRIVNRLEAFQESRGKKQSLGATVAYFWRRLFPSDEYMKFYSPQVSKHPWMMPAFYVQRLFKALVYKRKKITKELDYMFKETSRKGDDT